MLTFCQVKSFGKANEADEKSARGRALRGLFLLGIKHFDSQVAELAWRDLAGRFRHQILPLLRLGEGDDVADAGASGEHGDETVESEGDAAVGRGAEGEGFEHVAEAAFHDVGGDFQHVFKDVLLHLRIVDTNGAAAEFDAVEDDVVVLAADFFRRGGKQGFVLLDGRGEGVVGGEEAFLVFVPEHEGKLNDPEEVELIGGNVDFAALLEQAGGFEADAAKDGAGLRPRGGGEEDDVAVLDVEFFLKRGFFLLGEKFQDGGFPFAVFRFDEGESLGAESLGDGFQIGQLPLGDVGEPLGVDGADDTARGAGDGVENLELGLFEQFGKVGDFDGEARVGLVHAVAVHGLLEGHAGEGGGDVDAEYFLPGALEHFFDERIHVLAVDEGHFQIDLGELQLAVGAQVLVAEAAGELVVLFHTRHH